MRNKIIATLIFSSLALQSNASDTLKVKIGGRLDTMAGFVKESPNYHTTNPYDPANSQALSKSGIVNDTKIDINIDGIGMSDIKYGGLIRLNADTSPSTGGETSFGDKTMFYIQHDKIGRLEAGNMPGAHALFEMDAVNFGKGTWGVDGFAMKWLSDRTKQTSALLTPLVGVPGGLREIPPTASVEFIMSPNLLTNYSGLYYSDAPKVNLMTQPIKELTLGFTYIGNLDSHGSIAGMSTKTGGPTDLERALRPASFREIFGFGAMIEKQISDLTFKANVSGEIGKAKINDFRDLKAYEAGLKISYKTISIGSSVGSWGKSLAYKTPVTGSKQGSQYWTAGFSQQISKFGYSVTYMQSKKAGGLEILSAKIPAFPKASFSDSRYNKFNNLVLDIDYQVAPGFLAYAGLSNFRFKESSGKTNKGHVLLIGTRLLF
jgi:Gram-negative porin